MLVKCILLFRGDLTYLLLINHSHASYVLALNLKSCSIGKDDSLLLSENEGTVNHAVESVDLCLRIKYINPTVFEGIERYLIIH